MNVERAMLWSSLERIVGTKPKRKDEVAESMVVVRQICQRALLIHEGNLLADGAPDAERARNPAKSQTALAAGQNALHHRVHSPNLSECCL